MGMVSIIKETNKMLGDVTFNIEECIAILTGPKTDRCDCTPAKDPECLMDDITIVRDKAAMLYEMSCKLKNILNGDERPIGECLREPRY